jgi:glycosyltransferase 2 family protein
LDKKAGIKMDKRIGILIRAIVSITLIAVLVRMIDWADLKDALVNFKLEWLAVASIFVIAAVIVSAIKWKMVFGAQNKDVPLKKLWDIYWVGLFYNNFLPSSIGGDGVRIFLASKIINDGPAAATSVVVERILATVAIGVVGIVGCAFTKNLNIPILYLFIGIVALCVGMLSILFMKSTPKFLSKGDNRVKRFVNGMMEHGAKIRANRKYVFKALVWSVAFQLSIVIINCALFAGMGIGSVSFIDAMYLVPAASVASMIPLGINGYGLREGAYVALLASYGVGAEKAFTVSIIFAFLVSISSIYGAFLYFFRKESLE